MSLPEDTGLLKHPHKTRGPKQFYHVLKEVPPPSPKKLDGTPRLGLSRWSSAGIAPSCGGATEHKAVRWPRQPRWEPGARHLRGQRRGSHKGCAHGTPAPLRSPQRGFGGLRDTGYLTARPAPSPAGPGAAAAPSPARPAEQSPRQRSPAASRRLLPSPTAPPPAGNAGAGVRAGSAGGYPAPQPIQRRRTRVPLAAPVAAPRLAPCARAPGSGLISKLPPPPPPPGRAEESVKLPSSMQLPQPSRCLSPSPGRPGPALGWCLLCSPSPPSSVAPQPPRLGKGEKRD